MRSWNENGNRWRWSKTTSRSFLVTVSATRAAVRPAVKVARDVGGYETTAETRTFAPDPEGLEEIRSWCDTHLPDAPGPEHLVKTCLYTLTPDRDFIVDALPDRPEVLVAIGAGHAFKFASALGRVLSELAIDGSTEADLSAFSIDRPILRQADPPRNFVI